MLKIGIMGGSFDPPHKAHLEIANAACEALGLDEIFFIPAFSAPLKPNPHIASFDDRLEMLKISLKKFGKKYRILEIEKERGGISYSVDTVKFLIEKIKDAQFFWIIGTDQLLSLHKWHNIEELARLASFAVAKRGNEKIENHNLPNYAKIEVVPFEPMEVSSTEIRENLKKGNFENDFVDENVLNYIKEKKLYI